MFAPLPPVIPLGYLVQQPSSSTASLVGVPLFRTAIPPPPPVPEVAYFSYSSHAAPVTVSITYPEPENKKRDSPTMTRPPSAASSGIYAAFSLRRVNEEGARRHSSGSSVNSVSTDSDGSVSGSPSGESCELSTSFSRLL